VDTSARNVRAEAMSNRARIVVKKLRTVDVLHVTVQHGTYELPAFTRTVENFTEVMDALLDEYRYKSRVFGEPVSIADFVLYAINHCNQREPRKQYEHSVADKAHNIREQKWLTERAEHHEDD
jgi:hypothetical protein